MLAELSGQAHVANSDTQMLCREIHPLWVCSVLLY